MDSTKYKQILKTNVTLSIKKLKLKREWFLQQDNNPEQTLKSIVDYLKRHKLKLLEWPSQSPHTVSYTSKIAKSLFLFT